MCKFKKLNVSWPPLGWEQLRAIKTSSAQAILKDPASARVLGLTYNIEPLPLYLKSKERVFVYDIQIEGWEYNIQNESREFPVLSFTLRSRPNGKSPKNYYISNIKVKARPLTLTERSAHRAYMAALFMMKQIISSQVPDSERILKFYKIHPTQKSLYEIDNERMDSNACGLINHEIGLESENA